MISYLIVFLLALNLLAYVLAFRGNRLAIKRCEETLAALDAVRARLDRADNDERIRKGYE